MTQALHTGLWGTRISILALERTPWLHCRSYWSLPTQHGSLCSGCVASTRPLTCEKSSHFSLHMSGEEGAGGGEAGVEYTAGRYGERARTLGRVEVEMKRDEAGIRCVAAKTSHRPVVTPVRLTAPRVLISEGAPSYPSLLPAD